MHLPEMSTPRKQFKWRGWLTPKIVFEAILLCFLAKCINSLWPLVHKASSELFQPREQKTGQASALVTKRENGDRGTDKITKD